MGWLARTRGSFAAALAALTVGATGAVVVTTAVPAHAATFVVNIAAPDANSDGSCSLEEAVGTAIDESPGNTDCGPLTPGVADTITFDPVAMGTSTIEMNSTLFLQGDITFDGEGGESDDITLDANNVQAIRSVTSGTVTVKNLTIVDGSTIDGGSGGAINGNNVTVENATFTSNEASWGGAIAANGTATVTNSTFTDNRARNGSPQGGAVRGNAVVVTNSDFSNNHSERSGCCGAGNGTGGAIYSFGTVTVSGDSDFSGNRSEISGGAIHADGAVTVNGTSDFTDNDVTSATSIGGAVRADSLEIASNVTFDGNIAQGGGGCMAVANAVTITSASSSFTDNAGSAGGCINASSVSVTGATFTNNSATSTEGGAIRSAGTTQITDSTFGGETLGLANTANTAGGAVFSGGNVTISGTTSFVANEGTRGGAIALVDPVNPEDVAQVTIESAATFAGNVAGEAGGGAIDAPDGIVSITAPATFSNNEATGDGGCAFAASIVVAVTGTPRAAFSDNSGASGGCLAASTDVDVDGATFYGNSAVADGGAIRSVSVIVTNAEFGNTNPGFPNDAGSGGGAVAIVGGDGEITASLFNANTAPHAGAIYHSNDGTDQGTLEIDDSAFGSNEATVPGSFGGAIEVANVALDVTDSTFSANTSGGTGGAIALRPPGASGGAATTGTIENSTFDANVGGGDGNTIDVDNDDTGAVTLTNLTIVGNAALFSLVNQTEGTLEVGSSIIAAGTDETTCTGSVTDGDYNLDTGDGCFDTPAAHTLLNADPLLGALQLNGGSTPTMLPQANSPTSPAVNAIPGASCALTTDQRGLPRPEVAGSRCDIGAVELPAGTLTAMVTDLAPPAGTDQPYVAPTVTGLAFCPEDGSDGCAAPVLVSTTAGAISAPIAGGDWEIAPYLCKTATGCTPGSSAVKIGASTWQDFTMPVAEDDSTLSTFEIGFRPDVQARPGAGAYQDVELYGVLTTVKRTVKANGSTTYSIKLRNAGTVRESITLSLKAGGTAGSEKIKATHKTGSTKVLLGSGKNFALDPGAEKTITATAKAGAGTRKGSVKTFTYTVRSTGQSTGAKTDAVKVRVART